MCVCLLLCHCVSLCGSYCLVMMMSPSPSGSCTFARRLLHICPAALAHLPVGSCTFARRLLHICPSALARALHICPAALAHLPGGSCTFARPEVTPTHLILYIELSLIHISEPTRLLSISYA